MVRLSPLLVTLHMHTNENPMASLHIMQLASKESKIPLGYAQWNSKWMLRKIRDRIDLTVTSVNAHLLSGHGYPWDSLVSNAPRKHGETVSLV